MEYWSFNFTTFVRNRLKFNLQLNLLVFFVCRAPCQVSSQCNIDIHVFVFVIVTLHILANETRSDAEVVILNTARAILVSELWQSKGLCESTMYLKCFQCCILTKEICIIVSLWGKRGSSIGFDRRVYTNTGIYMYIDSKSNKLNCI